MTTSHISRRQALTKAIQLGPVAAAAWMMTNGAVAQQNKIAQKTAGYQSQPNDNHRCSECSHFAPPNACKLVDGDISPNGWCRLFAAKG